MDAIYLLIAIQLLLHHVISFEFRTNTTTNIQILAWYFPQFHAFPENDKNWGEGFTDWSLVKVSPDKNHHGVPVRKPGELGYYNLEDIHVRKQQGKLANKYGLDGLIYYHYWLDNRSVMSKILQMRLNDGEPNTPFMLCLANEAWRSKFYNLKAKTFGRGEILLGIYYDTPDELFSLLLPFFRHKDYITVDSKPVYVIYRPIHSETFDKFITRLRTLAVEHGFKGLHIVQCLQSYGRGSYINDWADAGMEFAPTINMIDHDCGFVQHEEEINCNTNTTYHYNQIPVSQGWNQQSWDNYERILKIRYFRAIHDMVHPRCVYNLEEQDKPVYRGGTVAWDVTPRYPMKKGEARRIKISKKKMIPPPEFASTAEAFYRATVSRLCRSLCDSNPKGQPNFYALFAWNEWGEGATLEPTNLEGRAYLEALKKAKNEVFSDFSHVCVEQCREMKKAREIKNCYVKPGCFKIRHCFPEHNAILLNNASIGER